MPPLTSTSVTRNVRAELARAGKTQGELAAALGMHQDTIGQRMAGRVEWSVDEIQAAADFLGVSIGALLAGAA